MIYAWNPRSWDDEARRSWVQAHYGLYSKTLPTKKKREVREEEEERRGRRKKEEKKDENKQLRPKVKKRKKKCRKFRFLG